MGGSTVLEADEVHAQATTVLGRGPGEPIGLERLYRASGDGGVCAAFRRKSGNSAPIKSVIRAAASGSDTRDGVVGDFSSVP